MEVYLVRHTETTCEKGICYGQSDVDLAAPFETIFDEIVSQLPSEALLFSSPLKRCLVLAEYIQSKTNPISFIKDDRLMEMNFGDWELKNWEAIPLEQLNPWMEDFVTTQVPNGESFTALHERVVAFLSEHILNPKNTPVVIVSHAGVIRSILCHQSTLPLKDAFNNKVAFGQVIKIEY
ncbi:alpha-ribazole phosphatase [Flavobacterium collinsii]|uniref:alpha-ribazole phosphatase n=1 Tax=Flavobacterium collinsii TaxID=1114861 RepID=UPI0037568879